MAKGFVKRVLKTGVVGTLSGAIVLGAGGRFLMRGFAILGGIEPGFSWGGTLELIAFGAIIGVITGLIFGIMKPYFALKNDFAGGLLIGGMAYIIILLLPIEGKQAAENLPEYQAEILAGFFLLFAMFGWGVVKLSRRFN